jgi:hypothetical protein
MRRLILSLMLFTWISPGWGEYWDDRAEIDWYFLIDSSASIEDAAIDSALFHADGYYTGATPNFDKLKSALRCFFMDPEFRDALDTDKSRVGLAQFSTGLHEKHNMLNYSSYASFNNGSTQLLKDISNLHWFAGRTDTHLGIRYARTTLVAAANAGGRDLAHKVIVIITDGVPSERINAENEAAQARTAGMLTYMVPWSTTENMTDIAGSNSSLFYADGEEGVCAALHRMIATIRVSITATPTPSPTAVPTTGPTYLDSCAAGNNLQATDTEGNGESCGGVSCAPCSSGKVCELDRDCQAGTCQAKKCSNSTSFPTAAPTEAPSEAPTPAPTQLCQNHGGQIDWFILLDSSSSIENSSNIKKEQFFDYGLDGRGYYNGSTPQFDKIKQSLSAWVSTLQITEAKSRVGLAQFSGEVYLEFDLAGHADDRHGLMRTFDSIRWRTGITNTHLAISSGQQWLRSGVGARQDAVKVLVIVTDGFASDQVLATTTAAQARDAGTSIFIVGYGNAATDGNADKLAELYNITGCAGTCDHVFIDKQDGFYGCSSDGRPRNGTEAEAPLYCELSEMEQTVCDSITAPPTPEPTLAPTMSVQQLHPLCFDELVNGLETDIDCGGLECPAKCDGGKMCEIDKDCHPLASCDNQRCTSIAPTSSPTVSPTHTPTGGPTAVPTGTPTSAPTAAPTTTPTDMPTAAPTAVPTRHHCEAGTHYCWVNERNASTASSASCTALGGGNYSCECPRGYPLEIAHLNHGLSKAYPSLRHACAYPTPSPTVAATASPSSSAPTTFPTNPAATVIEKLVSTVEAADKSQQYMWTWIALASLGFLLVLILAVCRCWCRLQKQEKAIQRLLQHQQLQASEVPAGSSKPNGPSKQQEQLQMRALKLQKSFGNMGEPNLALAHAAHSAQPIPLAYLQQNFDMQAEGSLKGAPLDGSQISAMSLEEYQRHLSEPASAQEQQGHYEYESMQGDRGQLELDIWDTEEVEAEAEVARQQERVHKLRQQLEQSKQMSQSVLGSVHSNQSHIHPGDVSEQSYNSTNRYRQSQLQQQSVGDTKTIMMPQVASPPRPPMGSRMDSIGSRTSRRGSAAVHEF